MVENANSPSPVGSASLKPVSCVTTGLPAASLRELASYARNNPGKLAYGSFGNGSDTHLTMEWLKRQTQAEILHVPFNGFGPDNFLTLFIQRVLVRALAEQGRLVEAEALGKETLDARVRTKANQDDVGIFHVRSSV